MSGWRYRKGAFWERELLHDFTSLGFKVIRAAASGVAGDTPDLIVLGTTKKFAVEAKAWKNDVYIEKKRFLEMLAWEKATNLPIYLAWKSPRKEWRFFPLAALRETEKSFVASESELSTGMTVGEMAGV